MFWCYTINCKFSLMFVVTKVKKNRCVGYWKLWNIMGVNRIMSWKIIDVEIWFDCISYASWLCEMEMRMKRPWRGQKWKEKKNKKWNDPREGKLRSGWDP